MTSSAYGYGNGNGYGYGNGDGNGDGDGNGYGYGDGDGNGDGNGNGNGYGDTHLQPDTTIGEWRDAAELLVANGVTDATTFLQVHAPLYTHSMMRTIL